MKKRYILGAVMALAGTMLILYATMMMFGDIGILSVLRQYTDKSVQNLISVSGIFAAIGMLSLLFSVSLFGWL